MGTPLLMFAGGSVTLLRVRISIRVRPGAGQTRAAANVMALLVVRVGVRAAQRVGRRRPRWPAQARRPRHITEDPSSLHGSPGSLTSAVDGPSVVGAVRSSEQAGPSRSFVGVPEPLVVAHEKGAVERGAGVDITSSPGYSGRVALERSLQSGS